MKKHIPQKDMAFENEPFALVPERGIDYERLAAEVETQKRAQEEARKTAEKAQLTLV